MNKTEESTSFPAQFEKNDIDISSSQIVYNGYFKMLKYTFRHRCFNGTWSPFIQREVFERGHAVAVLPYDPVTDQIVFVEQIRIGAMVATCSPWQMEIVAGVIDANETCDAVAIREMQEEAGLSVKHLLPMTKYLSSSGGCSESIQLYLGVIDANTAHGIHGLEDENEDILVHVVSRKTAMQWLKENKIENAASIIALQWLALNVDDLPEMMSNIS